MACHEPIRDSKARSLMLRMCSSIAVIADNSGAAGRPPRIVSSSTTRCMGSASSPRHAGALVGYTAGGGRRQEDGKGRLVMSNCQTRLRADR
jgi:hypothetical protein